MQQRLADNLFALQLLRSSKDFSQKRDDHYILTINSSWLWKKSTNKFKIREVGGNIHIEPLKDK